jgi:hypothetical protein
MMPTSGSLMMRKLRLAQRRNGKHLSIPYGISINHKSISTLRLKTMKFIIQSKCFGDTKWNFRCEANDHTKAISNIIDAKKTDLRLRVRDNSYRIVNKAEKVLYILPEDFYA